MSKSLAALMAGLVDYAGLFPPAALSVPDAVAEYAKHRGEPDAWMLGRFIAPAQRLVEVAARPELPVVGDPEWAFSVLVGQRESAAAALAVLPGQGECIAQFEQDLPGRVAVVGLEAPVPVATPAGAVGDFLTGLRDVGLAGREVFLEVLPGGDDRFVIGAIAAAAGLHADDFPLVGAKLRCGGVAPAAFPTCERVAEVIFQCAQNALPLKCTAGLHRPVRHRDVGLGVMRHGFLNVFGAGLLAWANQASQELLVRCLAETAADAFRFDDEGFSWGEHRVATADIAKFRSRALCGFGSCSFAEPRADLRALGLL